MNGIAQNDQPMKAESPIARSLPLSIFRPFAFLVNALDYHLRFCNPILALASGERQVRVTKAGTGGFKRICSII